ncbi:NmrA family protein [Segetibacter sp. 3557_3]|uniref:NmrA family NAD(P)-binding protein n=1 Tax=Segetibacter sp. 3557_3 TaxID=2547429 RepID=UPI001058E396|nr:NmrA family NAD(P)-binding protein [Segetibacter sp. 3557_3]TDH21634.1 NmrA family protein [Segetibacter sp. 3557_3]
MGSILNTQHTSTTIGAGKTITLAGATGELGRRIATHLRNNGATVRALVRKGSNGANIEVLRSIGASIIEVDYNNTGELINACMGSTCVVSALSGLREVIVDTQTRLLDAAVKAKVPRFIPSDYSIDFTRLKPGSNRNLDLRREFAQRLDAAPIAATSILNGMFTDLLSGDAPLVLSKISRVLYWGNPNQLLDFTTTDDTAAFTAAAALDNETPRYLRIAGEVASIRGLQRAASAALGKPFKLFRAGGLGLLGAMIKITRTVAPNKDDVFPPWQGMQYMHNMFTGLPKLNPLDNDRYPHIQWVTIQQVLERESKS